MQPRRGVFRRRQDAEADRGESVNVGQERTGEPQRRCQQNAQQAVHRFGVEEGTLPAGAIFEGQSAQIKPAQDAGGKQCGGEVQQACDACGVETVSYTHLDVYKRQVNHFRSQIA